MNEDKTINNLANHEIPSTILMFYTGGSLHLCKSRSPKVDLVLEALDNVQNNRIEVVLTKLSDEYVNKVLKTEY